MDQDCEIQDVLQRVNWIYTDLKNDPMRPVIRLHVENRDGKMGVAIGVPVRDGWETEQKRLQQLYPDTSVYGDMHPIGGVHLK